MGYDEGSWHDLESDTSDTFALRAVVFAATSALIVALEPSGAGMAAAAVSGMVVIPNVVDPEPWWNSSSTWGDLKNLYDKMHTDLRGQALNVEAYWEDSAAEQFRAFVDGKLLEALDRLKATCELLDSYCTQMSAGVIATFSAFLAGTLTAIVAAFAANAAGPVSPAAKIAVFGTWAPFVLTVIGLLVQMVLTVWLASKTLSDAQDELANMLADASGRIDTSSLRLPEPLQIAIGDPGEWKMR
ncbi:hypothetical protein [Micromonospora purpureochromogenes]|uniref:Uncharacterized protein n=1 Tax=Micromonospora purpureochromogenes TaxID=47872 RepID=A0ABX2RD76_9ACTN|nr:hypothetical protein [Micromonospora purpureochromogenes]NYF54455.1 hypothetical protein [Micromonospora purpureochromogenes]